VLPRHLVCRRRAGPLGLPTRLHTRSVFAPITSKESSDLRFPSLIRFQAVAAPLSLLGYFPLQHTARPPSKAGRRLPHDRSLLFSCDSAFLPPSPVATLSPPPKPPQHHAQPLFIVVSVPAVRPGRSTCPARRSCSLLEEAFFQDFPRNGRTQTTARWSSAAAFPFFFPEDNRQPSPVLRALNSQAPVRGPKHPRRLPVFRSPVTVLYPPLVFPRPCCLVAPVPRPRF